MQAGRRAGEVPVQSTVSGRDAGAGGREVEDGGRELPLATHTK